MQLEKYPETNSYWYLLRFLKARNFNYEKAKLMLSNFYEFRDTLNFKIIKEQKLPSNFLTDIYIRGYYNTTDEGYPLSIERVGYTDAKYIIENVDP